MAVSARERVADAAVLVLPVVAVLLGWAALAAALAFLFRTFTGPPCP